MDVGTFKGIVWPALKPELSLSWENQTFDTLNLLLVVHNKFPKVVDKRFWKEVFGSSSISDPECFSELTTLILVRNYFLNFNKLLKENSCINNLNLYIGLFLDPLVAR